jgi:hypothetical protein
MGVKRFQKVFKPAVVDIIAYVWLSNLFSFCQAIKHWPDRGLLTWNSTVEDRGLQVARSAFGAAGTAKLQSLKQIVGL